MRSKLMQIKLIQTRTVQTGQNTPAGFFRSKFFHNKDMYHTWIMKFFFYWPWSSPNDLGSRSWPTLGSWAIFVWNENLPSLSIRKIWTGHKLWSFSSSDLKVPQMTLGQGHDTPLGHGQSLWNENLPSLSIRKIWTEHGLWNFFFQWPWTSQNDLGWR